jgi:hypothetical protein
MAGPPKIEFVPKRQLDQVQGENDGLRKEIEHLKQQAERLRSDRKTRKERSERVHCWIVAT